MMKDRTTRRVLSAAVIAAGLMFHGVSGALAAVSFATEAPRAGAVVLPLSKAEDLDRRGAFLSSDVRAVIARALKSAAFDYKKGAKLSLRGIGDHDHILVIGTGAKPLTPRDLAEIGGAAAQATRSDKGGMAILLDGFDDLAPELLADAALGAELGRYAFTRYKSGDGGDAAAGAAKGAGITIVSARAEAIAEAYERRQKATAEAVAFARDLVNEPANVLGPAEFVERARAAFKGIDNVRIDVLDQNELAKQGMGAILSVGQGSKRPPRLLVVQYRGRGAPPQPIALVGKGITFDSGGISLKPNSGMWRMKSDMSGAAAVVGAALSVARQGAPVNVVAIAALAENMPGGGATRPGDIVRAFNGKTIEILNTDAEGRLVLADAVAYAEKRFDPAAVVDVATLTGAAVAALGDEYAALFSRHDGLAEQLLTAGRATGEELWRMPLHPNYGEDMRSSVADIRNAAEGVHPGAGLGAHFIGFFVSPDMPWAHLDIAGLAYGMDDKPTTPRGATGFPVRLLVRFLEDYKPVIRQEPESE